MAEQATGVLREVLSAADGRGPAGAVDPVHPRAAGVRTRSARRRGGPADERVAAALPLPLVDPTDPAAGFLATMGGDRPGRHGGHAAHGAGVAAWRSASRLVRALVDDRPAGDAAATELAGAGTDRGGLAASTGTPA